MNIVARWWKWAEKVLPPMYRKPCSKTNLKKSQINQQYKLAWWNIWWLRMDRETDHGKQAGAMLQFVTRQHTNKQTDSALSNFSTFVGIRKRELDGATSSPAKRLKNQTFPSSTHTLLEHSEASNTNIFKLNKSRGCGDQLMEGKVID